MKPVLPMRYLTLFLGCLALSSTCLAQKPMANWVAAFPNTNPGPRWTFGMAHDLDRGRTIIFGGTVTGGSTYANDTWEYNGTNWVGMKPLTSPPGRRVHSMAYDIASLKTVLFGGLGTGNTRLNDTWEYDGKTWTKMQPRTSPPARRAHGMVYDSARQRTVLFGGAGTGSTSFNDTWEWDGKNKSWTRVLTKTSPPARFVGMMAYDSLRNRVVLFGGTTNNLLTGVLDDTWEYDGKDWTLMKPATKPSARIGHSMAYDSGRLRTVVFGGIGKGGRLQDTWEYDGKNWMLMKPATKPAARYDFNNMVYDQGRTRLVLYGGNRGWVANDTWEYVTPQTLVGSPATISIATGGAHTFSLNAGTGHANRDYWIFGSVTGTTPGLTLGSVTIPLNLDVYTDITIAFANTTLLSKTSGTLNNSGKATASLNVPKNLPKSAIGLKLYHAYLVYDAKHNFYMGSNPVMLTLR